MRHIIKYPQSCAYCVHLTKLEDKKYIRSYCKKLGYSPLKGPGEVCTYWEPTEEMKQFKIVNKDW